LEDAEMKRINIFLAVALIILGVACGIVSTYATINPIQKAFTGDVRYIMIGLFIIVQISVFFLAMMKHYIEKEAPQHYLLVSRISNLLMVVSIVSTITFFNMNKHIVEEHSESIKEIFNIIPYVTNLAFYDWMVNVTVNIIFTWSVCVLLDVMAIKLPPVGFDLLAGIKNKRRQHSFFGMLLAILMYKPKTIVETKYKELYVLKQDMLKDDVKSFKQDVKTDMSKDDVKTSGVKTDVKSVPKKEKDLSVKTSAESIDSAELENSVKRDNIISFEHDVKRDVVKRDDVKTKNVKTYLVKTYESGDKVDVKMLKESFDMSAREWQKIKKDLPELVTKGTNTYFENRKEVSL
jgi:hypothetical protein